jgi:MFS family permease
VRGNILKLYISHFLVGLTFWWGIEKLFLKDIGFDPSSMALVAAVYGAAMIVLDVPAGLLADRWSRKGVLVVSMVFAVISNVVLGMSTGINMYLVGAVLYAVYWAASNGTYQAIMYDTLHELGRSSDYPKVMGQMYFWFCGAAGIADAISGYAAVAWGYRADYWLTAAVGAINLGVVLWLREPRFHKPEAKERGLVGLRGTLRQLWATPLLRSLLIVFVVMAAYDTFKSDLSQLYMLLYVSSPQALGWLWAIFAFVAALGYHLAHRVREHLNIVVGAVVGGVVLMAAFDRPSSIIWFMVVVLVAVMLSLQIETRVQNAVGSHVRASVFSVMSVAGRVLAIGVTLGLGRLTQHYGAFAMVRWMAIMMVAMWIYWLLVGRRRL